MKTSAQMAFDTIPTNQARAYLLESVAKQEMVAMGGRLAQIIGLPRSTGQIFGLLYFSSNPLSLAEICRMLGLSKASISTGTRQLLTWGAIRKVWIPGDRRDFYEAVEDFNHLLKGGYRSIIKPRIGSSKSRLDNIETALKNDIKKSSITEEQYHFIHSRLKKIQKLHSKFSGVLPILEKIFN